MPRHPATQAPARHRYLRDRSTTGTLLTPAPSSPERDLFDAAANLQQVSVMADQDGLESTQENMTYLVVASIEALCVDAVELAHQCRELGAVRG